MLKSKKEKKKNYSFINMFVYPFPDCFALFF